MTTTFFDRDKQDNLAIDNVADTDAIWLTINSRGGHLTIEGPRSKFLAAVATELDVIIIPRADLPEVDEGRAYYAVSDRGSDIAKPINKSLTAAQHRRLALEHLAVAEYLDAALLVDEAQLDAVGAAVAAALDVENVDLPAAKFAAISRRLVQAGVTVKEEIA